MNMNDYDFIQPTIGKFKVLDKAKKGFSSIAGIRVTETNKNRWI